MTRTVAPPAPSSTVAIYILSRSQLKEDMGSLLESLTQNHILKRESHINVYMQYIPAHSEVQWRVITLHIKIIEADVLLWHIILAKCIINLQCTPGNSKSQKECHLKEGNIE